MPNNFRAPLLLFLVGVLLSVVAMVYLYITARNREGIALIERGMNPNLTRSGFWRQAGAIAGAAPH